MKKAPPATTEDTTGWITRQQAADLLHVSYSTIKRNEDNGKLTVRYAPRESGHLMVVLDPKELVRLPRKIHESIENAEGELTARVFELLDQGLSTREIVIRTREVAPKIELLRTQWEDGGGADLVIGDAARTEIARFVGPFATVAELVARVTATLGATIEAAVPDDASDADVEREILRVLDGAGAPIAAHAEAP